MEACGGEVGCRIAQASRAFGSLCDSVFATSDSTSETKRMMYRSVVSLYGAKT